PLWIFISFVSLYTLTMSGHIYSYDDVIKLKVTKSIIERRTIAIGEPGEDKMVFSPFPIGPSIAYIPLYLLGRFISSHNSSFPAEEIIEFCVSWYNIPITALIIVFFYFLLIDVGYNKKSSLLTSIILGLGTQLWPYSKQLWSEPTVALLLIISLIIFNKYKRMPCVSKALFLGIFVGLYGCFRPETIICGIPFIVAVCVIPKNTRFDKRLIYLVSFIIGIAIFYSSNFIYNYARYNSFFDFGYSTSTDKLTSVSTYLNLGFFKGFGRLFFSLSKSIIVFSFPIILFFFSFKKFYSHNRTIALLLIAEILLVTGLFCFKGGSSWSWGPRYLVYIVPLFILPLVVLIQDSSSLIRRLSWTIFTFGMLVNILGVSVSHTVVMEKVLREEGENVLRKSYSAILPPPEHSTLCRAGKEFIYYLSNNNLMPSKDLTDTEIRYNTFDFWFTLGYFKGVPLFLIVIGMFLCISIMGISTWRLIKALQPHM
ncbi:hypothetical protein KAX02_06660, partial [candidate division WOR-3 bacterium]|nr:hypothetical protein [candidate division WOR-3 bacterium]